MKGDGSDIEALEELNTLNCSVKGLNCNPRRINHEVKNLISEDNEPLLLHKCFGDKIASCEEVSKTRFITNV